MSADEDASLLADPLCTDCTDEPRSSPIKRKSDGKIQEVRVATWPDGSELWRVLMEFPNLDIQQYQFRTMTHILETRWTQRDRDGAGMGYGFGFSMDAAGTKISSAPEDSKVWAEGVRHLRWFFDQIGVVPLGTSPLHPRYPVDPVVGRFRDLSSALEEARQIDDVLYRIRVRLSYETTRKSGATFASVADEMFLDGWNEVIDRVRAFYESLLEKGLRLELVEDHEFFVRGIPKVRMMRWRTDTGQWATVTDLLSRHNAQPTMLRFIVWLKNPPSHPGVVVLSDGSHFDDWFRENTYRGRLSISDEEAELFALLGEKLPFLWGPEALGAWALDRWGST